MSAEPEFKLFYGSEVTTEYDDQKDDCSDNDYVGRLLAASTSSVDFTVFGVGVMTLALLLFVEHLRRKLDGKTAGRPFGKAVLEGVYGELSTLGIVESFIFILHSYYDDLDLEKEALFAKVHFMLFYTAIFNAIQTCLLAWRSSEISNRLWVKSEAMDIDYYIGIRREFEEVQRQLREVSGSNIQNQLLNYNDDVFEGGIFFLKKTWARSIQYCRHPILKRKLEFLLVVIRFHQIRAQFLKANNLPNNFRVSDYLKRCELHVFKNLAHIHTKAWLVLMAILTSIYYLMGIIAYTDKDKTDSQRVGQALSIMYLIMCIMFVVISWLLVQQVKWIFSTIMHQYVSDGSSAERKNPSHHHDGDHERSSLRFGIYASQLELFLGLDPHSIIYCIKVMQFGFSLCASMLLVFWKTIGVDWDHIKDCPQHHGDEHIFLQGDFIKLGILLISYILFLRNVKELIPRYTLCTSMGELVHPRILKESISKFRLDEEIRKGKLNAELRELSEKRNSSLRKKRMIVQAGSGVDSASNSINAVSDSLEKISNYVYLPTSSLPSSNQSEQKMPTRKERRKSRTRSLSDGVAAMRMITTSSAHSEVFKKQVSAISSGVDNKSLALDVPKSSSTKENSARISSLKDIDKITPSKKEGRRRLRKTMSENVAEMARPQTTLFSVPERKPFSLNEELVSSPTSVNSSTSQKGFELELSTKVKDSSRVQDLVRKTQSDVQHIRKNNTFWSKDTSIHSSHSLQSLSDVNLNMEKGLSKEENDATSIATSYTAVESFAIESDVDDIPDAVSFQNTDTLDRTDKSRIVDWFRAICESKTYRRFDDVFGTMVCFYLVGMRVEQHLVEQNEKLVSTNSTDFGMFPTFWFEFTLLATFTIKSVLFFLINLSSTKSEQSLETMFTEIVDALLCGACLSLLLVSEAKRNGGGRFGEKDSELGMIEPFTALIAFRPLRHSFGTALAKFWRPSTQKKHSHSVLLSRQNSISFVGTDRECSEEGASVLIRGHDENHGNHRDAKENITSIWMAAVIDHPDIVKEHGLFSSELLQAMLGIDVRVESISKDQRVSDTTNPLKASSAQNKMNNKASFISSSEATESMNFSTQRQSKRWEKLSDTAKSIVVAGKVGQPVRALRKLSSIESNYDSDEDEGAKLSSLREFEKLGDSTKVDFQVIDSNDENEFNDIPNTILNAPNAPLIRNMRRCELRMPPLLDSWCFVDVVMTKHEIVYFDLMSDDNAKRQDLEKKNAVREALISEQGGKGLLMRDVASGRKIIGHTSIADIESIKVERSNSSVLSTESCADAKIALREYWSKDGDVPSDYYDSLSQRWSQVSEYRLKIHTVYGQTLYLRFLADLQIEENLVSQMLSEVNEQAVNEKKHRALLWCQTIVRLRGPNNLNQLLPHYGENGEEEINDFIDEVGPKMDLPPAIRLGKSLRQTLLRLGEGARNRTSDTDDLDHAGNRFSNQSHIIENRSGTSFIIENRSDTSAIAKESTKVNSGSVCEEV